MSTNREARAWVQVRAAALRANYARIRAAAGTGAGILPMVKADAYGMGVQEVVACLEPLDPWGFGVATISEGVALREGGVARPVVVLSPSPPGDEDRAVEHDLQLSVSDAAALARLEDAATKARRPARFHVDVDTGMGRSGFDWRTVSDWLPSILGRANAVIWTGCHTHLHSADEDPGSVNVQLQRFDDVLRQIRGSHENGMARELVVHALNSAGTFRGSSEATALVRPGIFLYGGEVGQGQPRPDAVASVHARIALVRGVSAGTTLGYGAAYTASGPERWGTLTIGYGDGLPRSLGNRGSAIVHGVRVPIIGRISMDVTVVDISGVPAAREGDVATLLGEDGGERISLDEIATEAGTISYEVLTGLTRRLPRIWKDEEG